MLDVYRQGFQPSNIIGKIDKDVKSMIADKLSTAKNVAFVNSTWIENDRQIQSIKGYDTVFVYSGPDWESTNDTVGFCGPSATTRRMAHLCLQKNNKNIVHIGNTYGKNYFSYWLYFVYKNLHNFLPDNFDSSLNYNHRTYMCLNRKPHSHRVELVEKLHSKSLLDKGYVTLGFDNNSQKQTTLELPMTLEADKDYKLGPEISGDVGIPNDITTLGNNAIWCDHFLNVVTETVVHSNVFVSEKVYKPILGLRPFVVLGDNKVYDVLHDFGLDTFDDIFGNWYKNKNYKQRIESIVNLINDLEITGNKDRFALYKKLEHRLIQNRKQLIEQAEKFDIKINLK